MSRRVRQPDPPLFPHRKIAAPEEALFRMRNPQTDRDQIEFTRQYLASPEQLSALHAIGLELTDIIGEVRWSMDVQGPVIRPIYRDWNRKLGEPYFGDHVFERKEIFEEEWGR